MIEGAQREPGQLVQLQSSGVVSFSLDSSMVIPPDPPGAPLLRPRAGEQQVPARRGQDQVPAVRQGFLYPDVSGAGNGIQGNVSGLQEHAFHVGARVIRYETAQREVGQEGPPRLPVHPELLPQLQSPCALWGEVLLLQQPVVEVEVEFLSLADLVIASMPWLAGRIRRRQQMSSQVYCLFVRELCMR